ncbi:MULTISPECIES: two-component system sensor histidine kinase CreC [unclassified Rubrivivax]|uniref:two-component system sensor histidine kinase CreC n=1 Tax=unclassified Rubrivivax TaxID=2649762 RepID=UPI001E3F3BA2|nr:MULTISPECIES: two-component system sensor histidine kinase CreC [unclassified Rubrivivax]MCC9598367.1 two-component system sensor histidine kinase CreC [Rubrivivax sp. JA1055]MCC9648067.1 two-component system sensor histidine kinase CreC [Rubrivivax sp. JA1029]
MHIGLRLFFAFAAITGLAAFFVLRVFVTEIKPSVREVMEDVMVDSANLLAEVAAPELAALPAGGTLGDGPFAGAVREYAAREVDVKIWGLHKTTLDLRVVVTDAAGRVVFDSGTPPATGQDYSRWRDVLLTLRGEYGARTTRNGAGDESSVMHVAAPVRSGGRTVGVLVVAKPLASIMPFVERAERKVLWAGVLLLGLSLAIGVVVTLWAVHAVRRLRAYAQAVGERPEGPRRTPPAPPALGGELGELAQAMDRMRQRLEGREQLEHQVRALTHELKTPLAGIRGAAELLHEDLPEADRRRFVQQVDTQARRLQAIVEQMLELSKLESLQALPARVPVDLNVLAREVAQAHGAGDRLRLPAEVAVVMGDAERLRLAISNVLANAITHAPAGTPLEVQVRHDGGTLEWSLRDHGPGVPDYALARLGERFFSTGEGRGSGLGLAIVRQVLWLHGGSVGFEPAAPGLRVVFRFP